MDKEEKEFNISDYHCENCVIHILDDFVIRASEHDKDSLWFTRKDGEGMHLKREKFQMMMDEMFRKYM